MSTENRKLLELIVEESRNSTFFDKNKMFKLVVNESHDFEFIIIDLQVNRAEIFIRFNSELMTIVEFTSLTQFKHQFCVIEDLQEIFTKAFQKFFEASK